MHFKCSYIHFIIDAFEPLSFTKDMCKHQGRSWCSFTGPKLPFKFHRFQRGVSDVYIYGVESADTVWK